MLPILIFVWLLTVANFALAFSIRFAFTSALPAFLLIILATVASTIVYRKRSRRRVKYSTIVLVSWLCILPFDAVYYVHSIYLNISL
jgi:hypothetical protein